MRYLSVCSGIEAATVAWHELGWEPVAFCEIEKLPSLLLQYYYPWIPNLGNMTKLRGNEYYENATIDLLVGGTPCQSFSIAGLRKGLDSANGNLALWFCRILLEKQPPWFVWENVPGVFSSFSGGKGSKVHPRKVRIRRWKEEHITETSDFAAILNAFRECGYSVSYRVLDSQYFGVPQRRRRVFVVGYLGNDWRPPAAVLFERESLRRDFTPRREKGKAVAALTSTGAGTCGADDNQAQAGHIVVATLDANYGKLQGASGQDLNHGHSHLIAFGGNNTSGAIDTATALNGKGSKSGRQDFESETFVVQPTLYSIMPQNSGKDYKAREVEVSQPLMAGGPVGGNQGGDYVVAAGFMPGQGAKAGGIGYQENTSPTLKASSSGTNTVPAVISHTAFNPNASVAHSPQVSDDAFPAVRKTMQPAVFTQNTRDDVRYIRGEGQTVGALAAQAGMKQQNYVHASSIRRLTPLECERLQGFPDNYTNIPGASDSARYKAIGNSMTVQVMSFIGKRIEMVDRIIKTLEWDEQLKR
jgi:DNA (cytosine-5)-methyltransferase 1